MIIRPRIIYVVRLGEVEAEHLVAVSESIQEHFALESRVMENQEILPCTLDHARNQYNSNLILKKLLQICPADALKILGITNFDLFSPIFSYVFGEAQFGGKGAVISTFRLRGDTDGRVLPGCPPLCDRVEKEAIHELGHTFGLRHCADPDCVMHYSVGVQCADRKFAFFCRACRELMLWHMAADLFLKA
ncbi:archaemetzincin family Zn-dependent metalloprotease [Desulfoferrobacter suflitae]|uniref:archaemetzincin family Zn-dependent metalloprotease n=1 Tax=Desulfoferrobacter suflitae TaxID=2865782 RepID=UPI0021644953|nr:archaemetzincin family Zn-dependent metalloprotease [Desulfoferrobacter suflitae]MCK8600911.1 archaemetzincin family Zn-dependent metalloprotease [Desulfoferrobacter suflitae]